MGAILILLYSLSAVGTPGKRPDLGKAVGLLLAANGITASLRLFLLLWRGESMGVLTQADKLYVAIGGLAAFWLSCATVLRTFAELAPEEVETGKEKSTVPETDGDQ